MTQTVLLLLLLAQTSQPPVPGPLVGSQAPQQQAERQTAKPEQPVIRDPTAVTNAPLIQINRTGPTEDAQPQQQQPTPGWWSAYGSNWIMAAVTFVLGVFTWLQLQVNWRTERHFQSTERAYIALSNYDPGMLIRTYVGTSTETPIPSRQCYFGMKIYNAGNTPARITATFATDYVDETLPAVPPYDAPNGVKAFLVKTGEIRMHCNFTLTVEAIEQLHRGEVGFWMIGYADYIDVFGIRHRTGYARRVRQFSSSSERDIGGFPCDVYGLDFELARGYNYDRRRVRGEGDDWDEEQ